MKKARAKKQPKQTTGSFQFELHPFSTTVVVVVLKASIERLTSEEVRSVYSQSSDLRKVLGGRGFLHFIACEIDKITPFAMILVNAEKHLIVFCFRANVDVPTIGHEVIHLQDYLLDKGWIPQPSFQTGGEFNAMFFEDTVRRIDRGIKQLVRESVHKGSQK